MPARHRRSPLVARLSTELAGGAGGAGDPAARSQAAILDELRRALLDGGVPPGTPIPLDEVAALFGVSRIPVREALKTLIGEGLVEHRPHAGYTVAMLTAAELAELYLVREALESAALRAAVERAGPEDDREAEASFLALAEAGRRLDVAGYHRESRRFHQALTGPCGMGRLLGMLESAWNLTEPLRPMAHLTDADRARLHTDHERMLAAFTARDAEGLLAIAHDHHGRLRTVLAALPTDTGLFAE